MYCAGIGECEGRGVMIIIAKYSVSNSFHGRMMFGQKEITPNFQTNISLITSLPDKRSSAPKIRVVGACAKTVPTVADWSWVQRGVGGGSNQFLKESCLQAVLLLPVSRTYKMLLFNLILIEQ